MTRCPPFAILPACSVKLSSPQYTRARGRHWTAARSTLSSLPSPRQKNEASNAATETRHKYRGKRRRTLPKATAMDDAPDAPISDRPNADTEPRDSGGEIDAAVEFISASQKKIGFFESEPRLVGAPTVNTMLCEIGRAHGTCGGFGMPPLPRTEARRPRGGWKAQTFGIPRTVL
ncbi:hypothetical protein HPB52_024980 [Rhipicephalus sanguineus]|uniref:Uncharacterized protein n=1 Tax=Rhipicephalus sanguineus TaxID=34632 RepID=A0A9D4TDN2_RHISA|nr:hypothetical protein HPB52_024980 [Rhipicephalus sanguineus]